MFDDPEKVPYNKISPEIIDCPQHRALALEASRRSMVLLKNDGALPLSKETRKIAVIGPNADSLDVLLGNYNGTPSSYITALGGIRAHFSGETVFATGCDLKGKNKSGFGRAPRSRKMRMPSCFVWDYRRRSKAKKATPSTPMRQAIN